MSGQLSLGFIYGSLKLHKHQETPLFNLKQIKLGEADYFSFFKIFDVKKKLLIHSTNESIQKKLRRLSFQKLKQL